MKIKKYMYFHQILKCDTNNLVIYRIPEVINNSTESARNP